MPHPAAPRSLLLCVGTLLVRSSGQRAAGALDDIAALVQGRSSTSHLQASSAASRYDLGRLARAASRQPAAGVNCTAFPEACAAPFHCDQKVTPEEFAKRMKTIAVDGHVNFHAWCKSPQYWSSVVKHCLVEKDLVKSAWTLYEVSRSGALPSFVPEMDASYCFIEGHCTNEAVTASTTVEQAESMCDARYGHSGWAEDFGWQDLSGTDDTSIYSNDGFKDGNITRKFLKLACAMGNYHCDVMYCKETYCKQSYYVNKYGHLLPKVPGHLLVQKE